jgi:hypothetical protein
MAHSDPPEGGPGVRWSSLALVALVAAATADVTGRIAVVGPVRLTVYQGLVAVVAVLTAIALYRRRIVFPRSRFAAPAAAFAATLVLSLLMAHDLPLALTALASMLSSMLLAYLALVLIDRPSGLPTLVWGIVGVAALLGAAALVEFSGLFALQPVNMLWGAVRSRVTFSDPNILGSFLAFASLLGIASVPTLTTVRAKVIGLSGIALAVAGIACTQSRGAVLGVLVGAAVLLVVADLPRRRKLMVATIAVFAAVVLTVALSGDVAFRTRVIDVGKDESAIARVWMAEGALRAWADHPMGVGIGDFKVVYPAYADPRVRTTLTESHTMYTAILLELGFLGLAAAVYLGVCWFRATRSALSAADRSVAALARGVLGAGFALGAQAFTYSLETSKYLWLTIGLGFVAARLAAAPALAVSMDAGSDLAEDSTQPHAGE